MLKIFRSNKYSLYMEIKIYVEENILYNFSSRYNHCIFWDIFFNKRYLYEKNCNIVKPNQAPNVKPLNIIVSYFLHKEPKIVLWATDQKPLRPLTVCDQST